MWYKSEYLGKGSAMHTRTRALEFLKETTGVETVEYAVAAALLIVGVLIGLGGMVLAVLPLAQAAAQTIFGV